MHYISRNSVQQARVVDVHHDQLTWSMLVAGQTRRIVFSAAQVRRVAEVEIVEKEVSQEFHIHLDVHFDMLVHLELLLLLCMP